jgi:hypothetical protein
MRELHRVARGEPTGERRPLHWVRGHFKAYRPERPLFGKYHGRFWWQPALHGHETEGRVDKDYAISEETS